MAAQRVCSPILTVFEKGYAGKVLIVSIFIQFIRCVMVMYKGPRDSQNQRRYLDHDRYMTRDFRLQTPYAESRSIDTLSSVREPRYLNLLYFVRSC